MSDIEKRLDEILDRHASRHPSRIFISTVEAKQAILELIDEARVDELNRFHLFRTDDGSNERYKAERIAQLTKSKITRKDDCR